MSICTTESLQSVRELDSLHNWQDRQSRAEAELAYQFEQAIKEGNPDATPDWTGTCPDYKAAKAMNLPSGSPAYPRRQCTVEEAFRDALDYTGGPDMRDVVKLVSLAMNGSDLTVALAATQLVKRASAMYVRHNCAEVE